MLNRLKRYLINQIFIKFGVKFNVLPVFNGAEVILRNKQLAEEVAAMG